MPTLLKETMAQMFGVGERKSTLLETAKGIGKSILRELLVQPGIEEAPPSKVKERQLKLKEWLKPRTEVEEKIAKVPRAISEIAQEVGGGILKGVTAGYIEPEPTKLETEAGKKVSGAAKTIGEMLGWIVPFGAITKGFSLGVKTVSKIPLMAKVVSKIAPTLPGRMAELAVPFAVYEAIAKPEPEEGETREEAAMRGAIMGAIFPVPGAVMKPITKPIMNIAKRVLKEIGKKPELIRIADLTAKEKEVLDTLGAKGETISKAAYEKIMQVVAGIKPVVEKEVKRVAPPKTMAEVMKPAKLPTKEKIIKAYRGVRKYGEKGLPTEGEGLYVTPDIDFARGFGRVYRVDYIEPKKLFIVKNDYLPLFDELFKVEAPIKPTDSKWIKLNKQIIQKEIIPKYGKDWWRKDEAIKEAGKLIAQTLKKEGYEGIRIINPKFKAMPPTAEELTYDILFEPEKYIVRTKLPEIIKPPTMAEIMRPPKPPIKPPTINLERIKTPDEIKKQILDWTTIHAPEIEARMPRMTFKEVEEMAARIATEEGISQRQLLRMVARYFPKDNKKALASMQAVRNQAIAIETRISELQKALKTTPIGSDEEIRILAQLAEAQLGREAIWQAYAGIGRFSAQALSFRRMMAEAIKGTSFERMDALSKLIRKTVTPDHPKYQQLVTALRGLDVNDPKAVINFLKQVQQPTFWDRIISLWYNNILSGIPTNVINFTGNTIFGLIEAIITRPLAVLIDIPLSKLTGRQATYTGKGLLGYYAGAIRGMRKGAHRAVYILKNGVDPEDIIGYSKWDIPRVEALPPLLVMASRAMKGADALFRGIWEEARKTEIAVTKFYDKSKGLRQIIREAEQLIIKNDPKLIEEASRWGKWMTFNEAPDAVTRHFIWLRDNVPVMRPIIPFINIAANLMKRGVLDYSPLGFRQLRYIKDPELAAHLARASIGTMLMASGYLMYKGGDLILSAPKTGAERDLFYREGKQPYSIRIGDTYIPFRRIEPFVYPFMIGALIGERIEKAEIEGENLGLAILRGGLETSKLMLNASYLSGLYDFISVMDEIGDPVKEATDLANRIGTGMIPYSGFLRSIANALDPEVKRQGLNPIEYVMANLPEISKQVPARLNVYGEAITGPGKELRGFLPFVPTRAQFDFVDIELKRLGITVGYPTKKITVRGMTVELEPEEYDLYVWSSGGLIRERLREIIKTTGYLWASDMGRKKVIEDIIRTTREEVKIQLYPRLTEAKKTMGKLFIETPVSAAQ